jgi:hypothetical protein
LNLSNQWAIVVRDQSPVRYGMARMLSAYLASQGVDLLVTRDFGTALAELARRSEEPKA